MEILLELVLEVLGQVILEFLLDGIFRGFANVLSNRVVRAVLGAGLAVTVGVGGGIWWGDRVTELGRTTPPKALWISLGLAVAFLTLALAVARRRPGRGHAPEASLAERISDAFAPWRWSMTRLLGFALFNAAIAAGIAVGFRSYPE